MRSKSLREPAAPAAEPPWVRTGAGHISLTVSVRPASGRREIVRISTQGPLIALNSVPERGKANQELIAFIAELFHLPRSAISVIRGESSRLKVLRIASSEPAALAARAQEVLRRAGQDTRHPG